MSAYRHGEGKVHIRQTASYGRQADMAVSLINDYVKIGGHLSDIAILYRVKKEASVLVNTLETIGMPFLQGIMWMIFILAYVLRYACILQAFKRCAGTDGS